MNKIKEENKEKTILDFLISTPYILY